MRILVGVSIAVIVLLALLGGALFAVKNWGTQELVTAYDVYGTVGPSSIEEMTARSKVVARVRFVSVRAVGQRAPQNYPSSATKDTGYYAALEYTFTVLEYLKGSGGSQVTAYAVGSDVEGFNDDSAIYATTQAKAAKLAEDLLEVRDLRWENREAILFLRHVPAHDYYWLGLLDLERSYRNFTVRSTEFKAWLPDASIPATTTATTTRAAVRSGEGDEPKVEQRFLTEDPGLRPWATTRSAAGSARSGGAGAAPATPVVPSVGLSDLKARIAAVERQIAEVKRTAPGHSAETYSDCIADLHHEISRRKAVGWSYWRTDQAVESGKAGILHSFAIAFRSTPSPVLPEGSGPGQWFEGPDADLIRMEEPGHVVATRPLPAGGYRVFYLARSTAMAICDVYPGSRHDEEYVPTQPFHRDRTARNPGGVVLRSVRRRRRRHRHDHRGHYLMAASFGGLRAGWPGHGGPDRRRHRPCPRLHRPGRHDHAVADRRRRDRDRRHADLGRTHPALECRGQAHAPRPPSRGPHTDGDAHADTDRQAGDIVPGQP